MIGLYNVTVVARNLINNETASALYVIDTVLQEMIFELDGSLTEVREDQPVKFHLKLSGGFYQSYGVTVQQDDGPVEDYIANTPQDMSSELDIDIQTAEVA